MENETNVSQEKLNNLDSRNYASFYQRLAAGILDTLILIPFGIAISYFLGTNPAVDLKYINTSIEFIDVALTYLFMLSYYVLFWTNSNGSTLAMKFLGIKLVRDDVGEVKASTSFIRCLTSLISALFFALGFLWMIWDRKRQTWHDKLSDTVVVRSRKEYPLLTFTVLFISLIGYFGYINFIMRQKNVDYQKNDTFEKTLDVNDYLQSGKNKYNMAVQISNKDNLTDTDKNQVKELVSEAIKEVKRATEINPNSFEAWYQLGLIYKDLVSVEVENADTHAITSFEMAAKIKPEYSETYLQMGAIYARTKNFESAIEYFIRAADIDSDNANIQYNIGLSYKELGDIESSRRSFEKALGLLPLGDSRRVVVEKELKGL